MHGYNNLNRLIPRPGPLIASTQLLAPPGLGSPFVLVEIIAARVGVRPFTVGSRRPGDDSEPGYISVAVIPFVVPAPERAERAGPPPQGRGPGAQRVPDPGMDKSGLSWIGNPGRWFCIVIDIHIPPYPSEPGCLGTWDVGNASTQHCHLWPDSRHHPACVPRLRCAKVL